jgi:hypothetical protein
VCSNVVRCDKVQRSLLTADQVSAGRVNAATQSTVTAAVCRLLSNPDSNNMTAEHASQCLRRPAHKVLLFRKTHCWRHQAHHTSVTPATVLP